MESIELAIALNSNPVKWIELAPVFAELFPRVTQVATDNWEIALVEYESSRFFIRPCWPPEADGHAGKYGFNVYGPAAIRKAIK